MIYMMIIGGILGFFVLSIFMSIAVDVFRTVAAIIVTAFIACVALLCAYRFVQNSKEVIVDDMKESIQMDYEDDGELSFVSKGKEYIVNILE